MKRAPYLVLLIVALCVLITPQMVQACSCAVPAMISDRFARASEVFLGEVTDIKPRFLERVGLATSGPPVVSFSVSKRWKGPASSNVSFNSSLYGERCGLPFKKEEQYLVYVVPDAMKASGNAAQIGICTGTGQAKGREEEMARLDELTDVQ